MMRAADSQHDATGEAVKWPRPSADLDALVNAYAEDAVMKVPEAQSPFQGRDAIRELFAAQFAEFPDGHMSAELVVEQGDTVVEELSYTGTNTGPLTTPDGKTLPATGNRIEMKGIELLQFRDSKIVPHDVFHDSDVLLGLVRGAPTV